MTKGSGCSSQGAACTRKSSAPGAEQGPVKDLRMPRSGRLFSIIYFRFEVSQEHFDLPK